jgi:hypothetical protein
VPPPHLHPEDASPTKRTARFEAQAEKAKEYDEKERKMSVTADND